jgi:hypothetical protein
MMAVAASKAVGQLKPSQNAIRKGTCKPRANCLKPKEIRKKAYWRAQRHFDLRQSLNYLKVKTTGRNPTGAILPPSRSVLP